MTSVGLAQACLKLHQKKSLMQVDLCDLGIGYKNRPEGRCRMHQLKVIDIKGAERSTVPPVL